MNSLRSAPFHKAADWAAGGLLLGLQLIGWPIVNSTADQLGRADQPGLPPIAGSRSGLSWSRASTGGYRAPGPR